MATRLHPYEAIDAHQKLIGEQSKAFFRYETEKTMNDFIFQDRERGDGYLHYRPPTLDILSCTSSQQGVCKQE